MVKFAFALLLLARLSLCRRPNILFILADDQDLHMESVQHMPYLSVSSLSIHPHDGQKLIRAPIPGVHRQRGGQLQPALLHCCALLSFPGDTVDWPSGTQSQRDECRPPSRRLSEGG